jgi:hypothetical protein
MYIVKMIPIHVFINKVNKIRNPYTGITFFYTALKTSDQRSVIHTLKIITIGYLIIIKRKKT